MAQDVEQEIRAARQRIEVIRKKITCMELASSGTLLTRRKTCGKPGCRCSQDENARHGPYHEYNRRQGGRLVHKTLTAEQAELAAEAIANYREIQSLLAQWERETVAIIVATRRRKA